MLVLPNDWIRYHGGYIAENLFKQLDECALRAKYASMMIEAALKLFVQTFPQRHYSEPEQRKTAVPENPKFKLKRLPRFGWQVNRLTFRYLPVLTDTDIEACLESLTDEMSVVFISPPDQENVLEHTLQFRWTHNCPATVNSFEFFFSWRVTTASIDAAWSHEETLRRLFRFYDRMANQCHRKDRLRMEIPPSQIRTR